MKVRAVPGATHGWFEFRSGDRQLLVKNINFSTAETMTGADLVYVSRDPDCVVLVQYKLLKEAGTPPVLVFKDKKRVLKLVAGHLPAHQALAQLNHPCARTARPWPCASHQVERAHRTRSWTKPRRCERSCISRQRRLRRTYRGGSTLAGRALTELMPEEPEVHGLYALMLLNDARRGATAPAPAVIDQPRLLHQRHLSAW
jgi:hypothetical protein